MPQVMLDQGNGRIQFSPQCRCYAITGEGDLYMHGSQAINIETQPGAPALLLRNMGFFRVFLYVKMKNVYLIMIAYR